MTKRALFRLAGAGLLALTVAVSPAQRAAMAPGTIELDPADIPTGPQETTATAGQDLRPALHQWGVVVLPKAGAVPSLDVPGFVHTAQDRTSPGAPRLVFSALYVHPPLKMAEPIRFNLDLRFAGGTPQGWFPYATGADAGAAIRWREVQAGVVAEGPETTSAVWMIPRAVSTPATLKVYKPGPPDTQPDDPGTTEGDVYLFARGLLAPDSAQFVPADGGVFSYNPKAAATPDHPVRVWVLRRADALDGGAADRAYEGQFVSSINQPPGQISFPAPDADTSGSLTLQDLQSAWNEAFAGEGLSSEEASAMSRMIMALLENSASGSYSAGAAPGRGWFVALMPQAWEDAVLPLQFEGPAIQDPVRVFCVVGAL